MHQTQPQAQTHRKAPKPTNKRQTTKFQPTKTPNPTNNPARKAQPKQTQNHKPLKHRHKTTNATKLKQSTNKSKPKTTTAN